jgi:hypothetical protein
LRSLDWSSGAVPRLKTSGHDLARVLAQLRVAVEALVEHPRVAADHRQQVVEVVRDAAGELAEAVEPLAALELLAQPLALGLELGLDLGLQAHVELAPRDQRERRPAEDLQDVRRQVRPLVPADQLRH